MDHLLEELPRHLAENIVALRQQRSMTQATLSKLAGLPRTTLAHFESGRGNPSLSNLVRIASALQISTEELLARPRARCRLFTEKDFRVEARSRGLANLTDLLPDPVPGLEFSRLELKPDSTMKGVPHLPGTREYFFCYRGIITIAVEGERFKVRPNEVLVFPGDQHHSYQNSADIQSSGVSVVVLHA
jgi:transcriptional regulator with XRE-family HTH domain